MGITFKENCPDTRNSKVVDLARELAEHGAEIVVEDPLADPDEVSHEYGIKLSKVSSEHPVDALVIAVGHDSYRSLTTDEIKSRLRGAAPVVADVKSLFDRHALAASGITVFRL
jgi:UDP-N-acetyl-D-galactosamine dehydrogenase